MSIDFQGLVDLHYAALYRFALSLAREESLAGDFVQQTFLKWARHGHQLREAAKAKTWLFTTLHREFLAHRRKFGAREAPAAEAEAALEHAPAAAPHPARGLDAQAVVAALGRLDETFRAPVAMFYLEEMSYAEIAECLEIPVGTVMSRLARGRDKLREMLRDRAS